MNTAPMTAPPHTAVKSRDNIMVDSVRPGRGCAPSSQASPQQTPWWLTASRRSCAKRYAARVLIVIEGVDGAGKRTLTNGLRASFEAAHRSVATLAFPRYGHSVEADLAAEALHGAHGDLSESVYAMAVLFILDRYVASNAAYSAARLHQGADGDVVAWVGDLEYKRLHLPKPDWQVLLDV